MENRHITHASLYASLHEIKQSPYYKIHVNPLLMKNNGMSTYEQYLSSNRYTKVHITYVNTNNKRIYATTLDRH